MKRLVAVAYCVGTAKPCSRSRLAVDEEAQGQVGAAPAGGSQGEERSD